MTDIPHPGGLASAPAAEQARPTVTRSARHVELDALRGLAAVAVVLFHYTVRYFELFPGGDAGFRFTYGSLGVQVFFGISGFVILMTLERSRSARDFLVSRFSRLYPAYWACMAITLAVIWAFPLPGRMVTLPQALLNLSMWQELLRVPHVDGVYWSLQVELIFYALMLGVFLIGWLGHVRRILVAWLLLALAAQAAAWLAHRPVPYVLERFLLLGYSPFFAIGAAAYLDFAAQRVSRASWLVFGLGVATAAAWTGTTGIVVAGVMVVLFAALIHRRLRFLDTPVLVFLGSVSYPLYLLHQNIGYIVIRELASMGLPPAAGLWVAFAIALALAWMVGAVVERPAMRWLRQRLAARPASQR